jgi:hypothetical protein
MGAELSVSVAFPVCGPPGRHGSGARHRLPRYRYAPDQEGRVTHEVYAGVAAKAHERKKQARMCRYISRPAISEQRLSLTPNGNIRYQPPGRHPKTITCN